jgi:DNA-binding CsgD family transcriptional regulator
MANLPSLPWSRINDFLFQVCAARTLDDFNALVCAHTAEVIPHDFPILCLVSRRDDLKRLAKGEQPNKLIDSGTLAIAGEPTTVADFNRHFRFRLPLTDGYFIDRVVADFRPFAKTEFVTDFIRPRKVKRCLGGWFRSYTIVIPRCKSARPFSDTETAIGKIISTHLENFYDILSLAVTNPEQSRLQTLTVDASQAGLTEREQEIALLLSDRLSMAEIADRLFISRRTVEKHAENIYVKLGIRKKHEVAQYLLSFRSYSTSS